jgi:hypothetical protein
MFKHMQSIIDLQKNTQKNNRLDLREIAETIEKREKNVLRHVVETLLLINHLPLSKSPIALKVLFLLILLVV